ncbi:MAG: hypothetical protein IJ689_05110 [Alphaproteobacteria bacterium]|nr:hypothetical protein [Alphaproteobacteria bacterium]
MLRNRNEWHSSMEREHEYLRNLHKSLEKSRQEQAKTAQKEAKENASDTNQKQQQDLLLKMAAQKRANGL